VADSLAVRDIKIEVYFHAAIVDVLRHRIPDATRHKLSKAHLKLAASASLDLREHGIYDKLVNNAVIRFFQFSSLNIFTDSVTGLFALLIRGYALSDESLMRRRRV
jgi:hypothetical protein